MLNDGIFSCVLDLTCFAFVFWGGFIDAQHIIKLRKCCFAYTILLLLIVEHGNILTVSSCKGGKKIPISSPLFSKMEIVRHHLVSKGCGFGCTCLLAHKADERYMTMAYRFYRRRKRTALCLAKVSFDTHLHAHDWSHMHASKLRHASIVYIDLFVRTFHPLVISSNQKMAGINTNASVQSTKRCIEGFFFVLAFVFVILSPKK